MKERMNLKAIESNLIGNGFKFLEGQTSDSMGNLIRRYERGKLGIHFQDGNETSFAMYIKNSDGLFNEQDYYFQTKFLKNYCDAKNNDFMDMAAWRFFDFAHDFEYSYQHCLKNLIPDYNSFMYWVASSGLEVGEKLKIKKLDGVDFMDVALSYGGVNTSFGQWKWDFFLHFEELKLKDLSIVVQNSSASFGVMFKELHVIPKDGRPKDSLNEIFEMMDKDQKRCLDGVDFSWKMIF